MSRRIMANWIGQSKDGQRARHYWEWVKGHANVNPESAFCAGIEVFFLDFRSQCELR